MIDTLPLVLTGTGVAGLAWGLWRLDRTVRRTARTDWGAGWMNWMDGLNRLFCRRFHRMNDVMLELPASGPAVVAANHISGLDPLLMVAVADRPLRFIIAREQYERFGLTWLFRAAGCIPVDRTGRPERAMREALAALRAGEVVALFPYGKIHLPTDPPRPIKSGAVRLAIKMECPIVPLHIDGVKGMGKLISAVVQRSHVSIRPGPLLWPQQGHQHDADHELQRLID